MSRSKKIILIVFVVLFLLAIFAAAVLPVIIRNQAVKTLEEATGRNVLIEKVSINPLSLNVSVKGFAIEEQGGGPFFSIAALKVALSPTSIYRRAIVLSEVTVDSPSLKIVRAGANRFNFTDIVERQKKAEEKPKKAGIFPFILKNVRVAGGSFELDDQVVAGGCKHRIDNLEINLPWLSSLPADKEKDSELRISMALNDAPLQVAAKSKPFKEDLESSVHIVLEKLNLLRLAVYIPQRLPLNLPSGSLSADTDIHFRLLPQGKPDLSIKGLVRFDTLALNQKNKQPLLKLPALEIKAANVEPFAGIFALDSIALEEPELFVYRDNRGKWMVEELLSDGAGKPPKADQSAKAAAKTVKTPETVAMPANTADKRPSDSTGTLSNVSDEEKTTQIPQPQFSIASLALKNGRIHFQDDLPRGGFKVEIEEINLALQDITNSAGKTGHYDLSLKADKDLRLITAGNFTIDEPSAKASVELKGLSLQKGWPYLSSYITTAPLKGIANLSGDIAFTKQEGLSVSRGRLGLKNFSVPYGEGDGIKLTALTIDGAAFQQKTNRIVIDRIYLSGGDIAVSRESNGGISVQSLIVPRKNGQTEVKTVVSVSKKNGQKKTRTARPFAYHLKSLEMDKFRIAFTDKSRPGSPRFTLRDTKLSVAGLRGPEPRFAKARFVSTFGKDATLQLAGDFVPSPFRYRGNIKIGHLPIRDFESYYPKTFNFKVLGGLVDANLALDIALKDGAPAGSFSGEAGVGVLHLVDAVEEEDLLKWQRLQLDRIEGNIEPLRLVVGEVSLNKVYSRIIIRKDGTLNLQELIKKEQVESRETGPSKEAKPQVVATAKKDVVEVQPFSQKEGSRDIRVGAVTVADGTVKFTDKHLPNDFETTFYHLGGRISGLSSETSALADVDLRGNLENHSPLIVAGKINPLRGDLFVDLKLSFADIELSPMSPYSETYFGYILKQGKLFLDLKYHIENKKLVSENRIHIDQFTFGDKVKSDKATSLPVKLGLALLKDRKGEINLDIPVTGSLDDPKFNIWRIVFQVVKNLLVKAVTAPFSLFSSLFAGEGDISVVSFRPGSSIPDPSELKKLEALAKGLNDRPSLRVSVAAYVDRQKDSEGYRNELFNRKLKREKFLALAKEQKIPPGQTAETITVAPKERSLYIKALYAKEKFPKPRDVKGVEITLPEQEMVKLILTNIVVDQDELEDLAAERADAVKDFLIGKGNIQAERIFAKKDDIFKEPKKESAPKSRVELNALTP
jgi:uncharacterized protein involved in outer membrane biogenesis